MSYLIFAAVLVIFAIFGGGAHLDYKRSLFLLGGLDRAGCYRAVLPLPLPLAGNIAQSAPIGHLQAVTMAVNELPGLVGSYVP